MKWHRGDFLHEGKGKSIYSIENSSHLLWMDFKDQLTAYNGEKKSSFEKKGMFNRDCSSIIFRYLEKEGFSTHWIENVNDCSMICRRLDMVPLEVVVRNRIAGSIARKFSMKEGTSLENPLVELYYKNDNLKDPFINSEQALALKLLCKQEEINLLKRVALRINERLVLFFDFVGVELIDFKLEFGRNKDDFILGDEISCDTCRLWEKSTGEKLDKDRFRLDLGGTEEAYEKVHRLLTEKWEKRL